MLRARVLTQAQLERALRRQAVRIAEQVSQQTYSSRHDCETIRPCRWEIGAQIDLFGAGQTAPWQTATRAHNRVHLRTGPEPRQPLSVIGRRARGPPRSAHKDLRPV